MTAAVALLWGALVAGLFVAHRPRPPGRRPGSRRRGRPRRLRASPGAVAAVVGAAGLAVWPPLVSLALVPLLLPRRARRRAEAARVAAIDRELPEVVDLVCVAVTAGLTVPLALRAVAPRAPPQLGDELARVLHEVDAGRSYADALGDLPGRAGEATRPLVAALVDTLRYGAPIAAALDQVAAAARDRRRRAAEVRARRLPVLLLFPLVLCILPAFGLVSLGPLIVNALRAVRP